MKHYIYSIRIAMIICVLTLTFASCKKSVEEISPVLKQSQNISNAKKSSTSVGFDLLGKVNGTSLAGSFEASGAFDENGDFSETYSFNGKYYHSEVVFTGSNGTMEFNVHGELNFDSETHGTGTLEWKLKKATGIYENLTGSGSGTVELSNWNANTGTGDDEQSWTGELEGDLGSYGSAPSGGSTGGKTISSDTFILLAFSQKRLINTGSYSYMPLKYNWSVAGASEISSIDLQISVDNSSWQTKHTETISTSSNSQIDYTYTYLNGVCGHTYNCRLKTTFDNGSISYSNVLIYTEKCNKNGY